MGKGRGTTTERAQETRSPPDSRYSLPAQPHLPTMKRLLTQAPADLWRKLSIYVVIPCLMIAGVNAWRLWTEHWEHKAHEPPVEERTEYPYMNIRTKNYFWGDGDKVSSTCSWANVEEDEGVERVGGGGHRRQRLRMRVWN